MGEDASNSMGEDVLLLPDCIHFSCCSPIASTSAAAPQLRPFQLPSRGLEGSNPSTSICRVRGSD